MNSVDSMTQNKAKKMEVIIVKDELNASLVPVMKIDDNKTTELQNMDQNVHESREGKQSLLYKEDSNRKYVITCDKNTQEQDHDALQSLVAASSRTLKKEEKDVENKEDIKTVKKLVKDIKDEKYVKKLVKDVKEDDSSSDEEYAADLNNASAESECEDSDITKYKNDNIELLRKRLLRSSSLLENSILSSDEDIENLSRSGKQKSSVSLMFEHEDSVPYLSNQITLHHLDTNKYKCVYCKETFSHAYKLEKHFCPVYEKFKKYECEICKRQFINSGNLKLHSVIHKEKKFMCDDCGEKFFEFSDLKYHITTIHFEERPDMSNKELNLHRNNKKFACSICDRRYFFIPCLEKHIKGEHSGIGNYKCVQCNKIFSNLYDFKIHILKTHRSVYKSESQASNKQFLNGSSLKQHSLVHKEKFVCNDCGKRFEKFLELKNHIIEVHCEQESERCVEKNIQNNDKEYSLINELNNHISVTNLDYKCEQCSKTFLNEYKLQTHACPMYKNVKKFKCEVCKMQFSNPDNLKLHTVIHRECKYMCEDCSEKFIKFSELKDHINTTHNKKRPDAAGKKSIIGKSLKIYACVTCDKRYVWVLNLKNHILKAHLGIGDYKCSQCNKTFPLYSVLKSHITEVHNKLCECNLCKKLFSHPADLKEHSLVHRDKIYTCDLCCKTFHEFSFLKLHIIIIHNKKESEKPYKGGARRYACGNCDKRYHYLSELKYHIKSMHLGMIKCEKCNMAFSSLLNFNIHKTSKRHKNCENLVCHICKKEFSRTDNVIYKETNKYTCKNCSNRSSFIHANAINCKESEKTTNNERKYRCGFCSREFFETMHLKSHLTKMHLKHKLSDFKCNQCNKKFTYFRDLNRHFNSEKHKNFMKLECQVCNRRFSNVTLLKQHTVVHNKTKYVCAHCGKGFNMMFKLKDHINRVHLKVKDFQCENCGKSFNTLGGLEHHIKCVHKKIKNFECEYCHKKFQAQHHLKNHIICVHERVKNFVCEQCGDKFLLVHHLRNHKKSIHKALGR